MKKLSNREAELKNSVAYKKSVYSFGHTLRSLRTWEISYLCESFLSSTKQCFAHESTERVLGFLTTTNNCLE